jgi:flagellar basal body-associated protein FliL
MSDSAEKSDEAVVPKKSGTSPLAIVLPALLAAGAAFGGAKLASAHAAAPAAEHVEHAKPPGPTVPLDPFLVTVADGNGKTHPMKVTIAIEFESTAKEEQIKAFAPRIRDATLTYLRKLTYDRATDSDTEKLRAELLERVQKSGAESAERILITDFVVQ